MLTNMANLSQPTKSLHFQANGLQILGRSSAAAQTRLQDQRRGFRFDRIWSSLDPEFHREIRQRYRTVRCKHAEGPGWRRLWWGNHHTEAEEIFKAIRRMASQYRRPKGSWAACRDASRNGADVHDNPTGVRPGRNIEDVERGALEDFLFGHTDLSRRAPDSATARVKPAARAVADRTPWGKAKGPVPEPLTSTTPARSASGVGASLRSSDTPSTSDSDYVIDPITNRKVYKLTPKTSLDSALKPVPAQFANLEAPAASQSPVAFSSDGPPPPTELLGYRNVRIDANPGDPLAAPIQEWPFKHVDLPAAPQEQQRHPNAKMDQNPSDTMAASRASPSERHPILESEDYVQNHSFPPEQQPNQTGTYMQSRYKGVFWHRDGGVMIQDDRDFSVLLGLRSDAGSEIPISLSEAGQPKYVDLGRYNPVIEPQPAVPEDPSTQYVDLDKYQPILDKRPVEAEDLTSQYNDLDKYTPVVGHERSVPEEPASQYDGLDQHKPVMEKAPAVEEDPSAQYEDLDKYKPIKHNEPKGRSASHEEERAYQDVPKYQAVRYNDLEGKPVGMKKEVYSDLNMYYAFRYNEPDGKPPGHAEPADDPAELEKYKAFRWSEPDGKPTAVAETSCIGETQGLVGYSKPVRHNEPDGEPAALEQHGTQKAYADLGDYEAFRHLEPDCEPLPAPAPAPASAPADDSTAELDRYKAVRHNESDGKTPEEVDSVAESLREFDLERSSSALDSYSEPTTEERAEDIDLLRASDVRSSAGATVGSTNPKEAKSSYRSMLEELLPGHYQVSDSEDGLALRALKGGRADESPEDAGAAAEAATSRLISSLDRTRQHPSRKRLSGAERVRAMYDPYSTRPQGLETSYAEECGGVATWPAYVRSYGSLEGSKSSAEEQSASGPRADQDADELGPSSLDDAPLVGDGSPCPSSPPPATATTAAPAEPTIYRILAYDPTMQTVNEAETSSTVADSSTALPPAEALLRLSNPTKFFPHFAPLQAQGFEIVSGSGDVLVFRKVREPVAAAAAAVVASDPEAEVATPSTAVNPIDMTGSPASIRYFGSPASANFASPTGYVTYDPEPLDEDDRPPPPPPPPRFRSNIDVHREEDVFSGGGGNRQWSPSSSAFSSSSHSPSYSASPSENGEARAGGRGPGLAKRVLVGATWVAGVSYALGVVGEYFTTGGVEGEGPKGRL